MIATDTTAVDRVEIRRSRTILDRFEDPPNARGWHGQGRRAFVLVRSTESDVDDLRLLLGESIHPRHEEVDRFVDRSAVVVARHATIDAFVVFRQFSAN